MMLKRNSGAYIRYIKVWNLWGLFDTDGYLIDTAKTPAEARKHKRRWWLFLSTSNAGRAWSILEGNIEIK